MEKLFSYGTLQQEEVQLDTFGRKLDGEADVLTGYIVSEVKIGSAEVIKRSGKEFHPILLHTGKVENRVNGIVYEITAEELQKSDQYEVQEYIRVEETFESGNNAWVYVSAAQERSNQSVVVTPTAAR